MLGFLVNILEQGFIFAIVSLGVYITYKILDFPDLSVDGTFPLGAAVTAVCLSKGVNPFQTCIYSILVGMLGGAITGLLHVKLKITNLLSGILVMIGLYSINLRIMGKSNISFFKFETIFTKVSIISPVVLVGLFAIGVKVVLDLFLKTKLGFMLKAVGDNEQLVTSLGVNKDTVKIVGLMVSNGLVALGGSIMAQHQGYAAVGMGTGTVVIGLAAVILGEAILKNLKFVKATTMALMGAILYKIAIGGSLRIGLPPSDLKFMTAVIVIIVLGTNNVNFNFNRAKREKSEVKTVVANTKSVQSLQ
ncbi:ABC transporter permease [Clostridium aestuarii]|uniref:ABC transporter permease n=1 Tax=Clostridium aestuarii TaxID=338193 RepID=A0ABT4D1N5_9CLOT|nr:ABC transporter permease [Clostridium aestuarii]MCY6485162.1 ABC transporter permease [Clostridium aestuarii]